VCGGLGIRVYRVVLASVDLVLVVADFGYGDCLDKSQWWCLQEGC
jgi:hypothetical protein